MALATAPDRMVVRLPDRPLTLTDVGLLGGSDENHRYELSEGTLSVMAPADDEHDALVTELIVWLVSHGYGARQVQANSGVRIEGERTGRTPDLLVRRSAAAGRAVWADPGDVLLVVEVVSPASETLDRVVKPVEYAAAGIAHFWRVERDLGAPTVHLYSLGTDEHGGPVYLGHRAVLLDDLVTGPPPSMA